MINRFSAGGSSFWFPGTCRVRALGLVLILIASLLALSACSEQPGVVMEANKAGSLSTSIAPPDMLTQTRAINRDELLLSIEINGDPYTVELESGATSGTLNVQLTRGQQLNVVVTWSEMYGNELLRLAQATDNFTVPVNNEAEFVIRFDTNNYSTAFDLDRDGLNNLDERIEGSDPTVRNVFADPIVPVTIQLKANIPERLRDVESDIDETLFAVAIVDRLTVNLTREDDAWIGQTSVSSNTDVLITYSFYSEIRPNAKLADWQGRLNSGEAGITAELSSNDYRYELDNDGDGRINLDEIVAGTNPEDKNDPQLNPCDISQFEVGCNTDTDGDGVPDSVETETADADGDMIPDFQESRGNDFDDDGANAELDRDENNPCIPNENAITCDDPSEPPVVDPPEPEPSLLSYSYYEGLFETMPDFNRLTPASSGTAETFTLPANNGDVQYAIQYSGKLLVEEAGEYTFYSESSDGSLVFIDGNPVVNNDGTHDLTEASGMTVLTEGLHDIVVEYFQNSGSEDLIVSWSSSTIDKQPIPASALFEP